MRKESNNCHQPSFGPLVEIYVVYLVHSIHHKIISHLFYTVNGSSVTNTGMGLKKKTEFCQKYHPNFREMCSPVNIHRPIIPLKLDDESLASNPAYSTPIIVVPGTRNNIHRLTMSSTVCPLQFSVVYLCKQLLTLFGVIKNNNCLSADQSVLKLTLPFMKNLFVTGD